VLTVPLLVAYEENPNAFITVQEEQSTRHKKLCYSQISKLTGYKSIVFAAQLYNRYHSA
jgi:hypothetical protein